MLLMFAWRMARPVNLFGPSAGLLLVGLGSFAVQTSIGPLKTKYSESSVCRQMLDVSILNRQGKIEAGQTIGLWVHVPFDSLMGEAEE
jgi:hypothetical protein